MKNLIGLLCLVLLAGTFTSCATSRTKNQVNEDRSRMSPMISKEEMVARISQQLDRIPNLTKKQREEIHDIHADVLTKSWDINHKIRQNKILLFKYLGADKYSDRKVNFVKKEVEKLYNQKLKLMIASFNKLKKILGKDAAKVMKHHKFLEDNHINVREF